MTRGHFEGRHLVSDFSQDASQHLWLFLFAAPTRRFLAMEQLLIFAGLPMDISFAPKPEAGEPAVQVMEKAHSLFVSSWLEPACDIGRRDEAPEMTAGWLLSRESSFPWF